jgi:hypothetical protein
MSGPYKFAGYYTNVDLANGLTANLAEIELALQRNPGQFAGIILFDQAKGKNESGGSSKLRSTAFATGWDGFHTETEGGFSQPTWTETGIAKIEPSRLTPDRLKEVIRIAEEDKDEYVDYLIDNLVRTGSSNSDENYLSYIYRAGKVNPLAFNLGISTKFDLLEEMQTGSIGSVDYFLEEGNISDLHASNPHALFLSNHGGSYLNGNNGDGPAYDKDASTKYLQVTELGESLEKAIAAKGPEGTRFGLIAFDECLMANIETATQLRDQTRYLLASQETIPGNGYDYFRSLSLFQAQGPLTSNEQIQSSSRELGLKFIGTYSERNPGSNTLSLTDTDAIIGLNQAIRHYADALVSSDDNFIVALLKNIALKGTNYDYKWLQDLGNVALISKSTAGASKAITDAAKMILEHLDKAIVANNQNYRPINGYVENASSGLTITLPTRFDQWMRGGEFRVSPSDLFKTRAPEFEAQTGWSRVLDKVYPLLLTLQTKSVAEPTEAKKINARLTEEKGSDAWFALQVDGYLMKTSNDPAINHFTEFLPLIVDANISNLMLKLNVLELRKAGSISISIEDADGQTKASWTQAVSGEGPIEFSGKALLPNLSAQSIKAGDKVVLIPDESISAQYDLHLKIENYRLGSLQPEQTQINGSSLFNFSLGLNESQEISLRTSGLPPASSGDRDMFFTDIVLLSTADIAKRLTITEQGGRQVVFTTNDYIEESICLDSSTTYSFLVEHIAIGANSANASSSDIALLIETDPSSGLTLTDALIEIDNSFNNWGSLRIRQNIVEPASITEFNSVHRIDSIDGLREGGDISASISSHSVNYQTSLRKDPDGGNQTFSSGIWSTTSDISLNFVIEGKSSNSARLGFFEVDTLTGAIMTAGGLIAPTNSQIYLDAAINNLVSPMIDLRGFKKEGSLEATFQAGKSYAALLVTEGRNGSVTALFSLANANPTKAPQLLSFGNGYFGFEDLVRGRDIGYDGDFNDITFYAN